MAKTSLLPPAQRREVFKLPLIKRPPSNPEEVDGERGLRKERGGAEGKQYYTGSLSRCLKQHETTYMMNLYRQHFYQQIEVLRWGKGIKIARPRKDIKLARKDPSLKTVFLDLDETLIHCDEHSNNYSVKLNFPLERGGVLAVPVLLPRLELESVPSAGSSCSSCPSSQR